MVESVWPLEPGRYWCVERLVTNDGSGISSTKDETVDDAEMGDRLVALLRERHTVIEEPWFGPKPPA